MKNTTDITILLDRSGSMSCIAEETIRGFNAFLKEQQKFGNKAYVTLVQFDHEYELLYEGIPLKEAVPLSTINYVPRGTTALLDAMGRSMTETRHRILCMPATERPEKVIFVTITDGRENHSSEYNRRQIFDMISRQRRKLNWEFLFLAANQDAIEEASHLGIPASHAYDFQADAQGTKAMFSMVNERITDFRKTTVDEDDEDDNDNDLNGE